MHKQISVLDYIDLHKFLITPVMLGLMWYYHNWSTEAFLYLALHGTYSVLWLIKSSTYPDKRFQEQIPPLWAGWLFVFFPLVGYYLAGYLVISRHVVLPPWIVGLVVSLYTLGIFLHYVGDAQKFYTLRVQKGLIEDGLFARTRNPNYLGEILMYIALGIMARHWLPFVVLAGWSIFFARNMRLKDRSLSRHPGYAEYKQRTGLLLPF